MHTAAVRRPTRSGAVASPPARRAGTARHALLHLQQLAGNAAVATAVRPVVQRQLKMTGPAADVTAALAMLQAASGLTFKQDKAKLVTITGTPKPPQSAELARRLQAIIADDKRTAQIDFGHERVGVWFGAAPRDEKHPIQQLRIDHFLSLEKGVPGGGAAILAHEINENYEAQGLGEFNWEIAVSEAHERSLGVENTILDQIQQASGSKRSGDRLGTYTVVLPGATAKAPQRWLHIEAHEHEFFVFEEVGQGKKATVVTTRRPVVDLGTFTCRGFAAGAQAIPKGCDATLARVAELLSKEPTASVMLRSASKHGPGGWYDLVIEEIRARMVGNDDTKGWARFAGRPPHWAGGTTVELVVRRPDLP